MLVIHRKRFYSYRCSTAAAWVGYTWVLEFLINVKVITR